MRRSRPSRGSWGAVPARDRGSGGRAGRAARGPHATGAFFGPRLGAWAPSGPGTESPARPRGDVKHPFPDTHDAHRCGAAQASSGGIVRPARRRILALSAYAANPCIPLGPVNSLGGCDSWGERVITPRLGGRTKPSTGRASGATSGCTCRPSSARLREMRLAAAAKGLGAPVRVSDCPWLDAVLARE